jgi:hypothetical protein
MRRLTRWTTPAAAGIALSWIAAMSTGGAAQTRPVVAPATTTFAAARTPWGDPDLRGTWPGGPVASVPFERAPELGTRATLTDAEAARRNADVDAQVEGAPGGLFPELGHTPPLTSLIIDPDNGRLPAMTEDRRKARAAMANDRRPRLPCCQRG